MMIIIAHKTISEIKTLSIQKASWKKVVVIIVNIQLLMTRISIFWIRSKDIPNKRWMRSKWRLKVYYKRTKEHWQFRRTLCWLRISKIGHSMVFLSKINCKSRHSWTIDVLNLTILRNIMGEIQNIGLRKHKIFSVKAIQDRTRSVFSLI